MLGAGIWIGGVRGGGGGTSVWACAVSASKAEKVIKNNC